MSNGFRMRLRACLTILLACGYVASAHAQDASGPYNVTILEGGEGLSRDLSQEDSSLHANAPWSMSGWVNPRRAQSGSAVLLAVGMSQADVRALTLHDGLLASFTAGRELASEFRVPPGAWTFVAVTFDGRRARLYADGREVANTELALGVVAPRIHVAPAIGEASEAPHFGGQLAALRWHPRALSAADMRALADARPDFDLIVFHEVGGHWPWQVKQWRGLQEPQDAWTLPSGKAPFGKPVAKPLALQPELVPRGENTWTLSRWRLVEAPKMSLGGDMLSAASYSDASWYAATVPGTVLTTLIDRGVYPDYDHGLDNMAIPESLARQSYWYRTSFDTPEMLPGKQLTLTFNGVNYAAEVWLNGTRLGDVRGAFIRGVFDVTRLVEPGKRNAIAVRVSPPPHPGIPHEESIAAGPGENGGWVALDGPTFAASEGWDWIPGIRDRNTGIWQDVTLTASGRVRLLDPQVITLLPLPKTDRAAVTIVVPLVSTHDTPVDVTLTAEFEGVKVRRTRQIVPGRSELRLTPQDFRELTIEHPRLWWPNGYGAPELYHLEITASVGGSRSDTKLLRFGIRHVTYELSLFDGAGALRRVEVDVAAGSERGERLIDNTHEKIKKSPRGWAASLTRAGETSPAVRPVADTLQYPHLTLRVNGVRILARGGNWGMDDSRKRIQRERLEPYFRLQRDANLNIVRNWMGNNDEEVFFDLCDEYGLMVLNDFWASTQDFQVEPQDPQLFLKNAEDTIQRWRSHPSIVMWFGRNEGVPQPILNEGLADLVARYDGTRHFTGSSNMVNLQGSGPYNYRPPVGYFTDLAGGFSVETGTPSLATLEAIQAMVPPEDRWPLSDSIAYHDWHFGGNGDVKTFMQTLAKRYGAGTSLEDFERKAQMMNYETYRAMFEGLQAHMWTKNSGRLLWMTHPAWPSNHWQIYSSDYDTHAAYFGVKKAVEPVHAQMNLPDYSIGLVNTTLSAHDGLMLEVEVRALDNSVLFTKKAAVDLPMNDVTTLPDPGIGSLIAQHGLVLVRLRLADAHQTYSENVYVQGNEDADHLKLNALPRQNLKLEASFQRSQDDRQLIVRIENPGKTPALATKLTLVDARGQRILPARYSDNYLAVFPGESRLVTIRFPKEFGGGARVNVRGWNVKPATVTAR